MKPFFVDERGHLCNDRNSTDVLFLLRGNIFLKSQMIKRSEMEKVYFNRLGKGADMSSIIFILM